MATVNITETDSVAVADVGIIAERNIVEWEGVSVKDDSAKWVDGDELLADGPITVAVLNPFSYVTIYESAT